MNNIHIIGCLTRDPDTTNTTTGIPVSKFTVAVNRKYKNSDGTQQADFISVVAWRDLATLCGKYLKKGSKCYIGGTLQMRSYEVADGSKRTIAEIVASEVEFLTPKSETAPQPLASPNRLILEDMVPLADEDLPF